MLEPVERLSAAGYAVTPHLSARLVRDPGHLEELVRRLRSAGVNDLFVIAGDIREPAGHFEDAAALLSAMGELRERFAEVGISGYPESHHVISDESTIEAMFEKEPMATYIVSQICFEAEVIATWVRRVRDRGTFLPIWIGVPGAVDNRKLVRISEDRPGRVCALSEGAPRVGEAARSGADIHADYPGQGARSVDRRPRRPNRGLPHLYLQRVGAHRGMAAAARRGLIGQQDHE